MSVSHDVKTPKENEQILMKYIKFALNNLNPSHTLEEQIDHFLGFLGMPRNEQILSDAFTVAANIDSTKLTYRVLITSVTERYLRQKETTIEIILNILFNDWINKHYPSLKKDCPSIGIIDLVAAFAKHYKENLT